MFDFIKKLFNKPTKKTSNKNHVASAAKAHAAQSTRRPERCKKEDKAPECALVSCSCEIKNAEPAVAPVEIINDPAPAESVAEASVEAPVEISEEPVPDEPENASAYIIKLVGEGIYNFELLSTEGKVAIKSGDYTLKRSCVSGVQSVKKNGATENIEDRTVEKPVKVPNPKYEISVDEKSKYRFSLKAPNGYVILTSAPYNSKKACLKAIETVRESSQTETMLDVTK